MGGEDLETVLGVVALAEGFCDLQREFVLVP
jgi:hypothetical protein